MRSTLLAEEEAFDPNRDAGAIPKESSVKTAVNPLAFLVGPVQVKHARDPAKNRVADLSKYIDEKRKQINSVTRIVRSHPNTRRTRPTTPRGGSRN